MIPIDTHDESAEPDPLENAARVRAYNEFHCQQSDIVVSPSRLGRDTVELVACGHRAVYTCPAKYVMHYTRFGGYTTESYDRACSRDATSP